MIQKTFDMVLKRIIDRTKRTLNSKGGEYARGDRLSNFKKAAAARETTPEDALAGMLIKHQVSIDDLIKDIGRGKIAPLMIWQEKIQDTINYNILLECLIAERVANALNEYEDSLKGGTE